MLSDKQSEILMQAKELTLRKLDGFPVRVYLFGSRAKGNVRPTSDIDIAVEPLGAIPPFLFQYLREAFEESHIPCNVDVIDTREANTKLIENIKKEGIIWKN